GDRVYVDPQPTCGTCHYFRQRRKSLCVNCCFRESISLSSQRVRRCAPATIRSTVRVHHIASPDFAALPPSIGFATASRLGYIGASFAGLKKAIVGPGKTLLINGATGISGYAAVAIALGLGCTKTSGIRRNKIHLAVVGDLSKSGRVVTVS
ncbi:hypothetical protein BJ878DRAFT_416220, partial [Calycina marina]